MEWQWGSLIITEEERFSKLHRTSFDQEFAAIRESIRHNHGMVILKEMTVVQVLIDLSATTYRYTGFSEIELPWALE